MRRATRSWKLRRKRSPGCQSQATAKGLEVSGLRLSVVGSRALCEQMALLESGSEAAPRRIAEQEFALARSGSERPAGSRERNAARAAGPDSSNSSQHTSTERQGRRASLKPDRVELDTFNSRGHTPNVGVAPWRG